MEHERGGPDRRDLGILKAAVALLAALGRAHEDPASLLPVPPPKRERTPEEEFAALEAAWPSH